MTLEVAGSPVERVLAALDRRGDGKCGRKIALGIERPQFEAAAVHVAHAVDRIEDVGPNVCGRSPCLGLEACDEIVEPLAEADREDDRTERTASVREFGRQLVSAVGDALDVHVHHERRIPEVARDTVERAEVLHDRTRL